MLKQGDLRQERRPGSRMRVSWQNSCRKINEKSYATHSNLARLRCNSASQLRNAPTPRTSLLILLAPLTSQNGPNRPQNNLNIEQEREMLDIVQIVFQLLHCILD